jgi:glutamate-1-semialdehyde 2,1-aminomutase
MQGKYTKLLQKYIPGGAHTYSRGSDQFSKNAPEIFLKGKGAYLYDLNKQKFLDYGMGLRSVSIGYSGETINKAAIQQIDKGMNLARTS